MALVVNMTIEELALFYFQKEIVRDFHHTSRYSRSTLSHHIVDAKSAPRAKHTASRTKLA
jgi:hypothetical protein